MRCPFCHSEETKVVDSRSAQKHNAIRRRRECIDCGHRFTTYEYVVDYPVVIRKNDGTREEYDRAKLQKSIKIACNKRSVSQDRIEELVLEIEKKIEETTGGEISSGAIGEMVMKRLRALDEVAYIRFASVYKKFQDLEAFRDQIDQFSE